jgi:serine/threonine protein kinase
VRIFATFATQSVVLIPVSVCPQNLLLDGSGQLKICDFGHVKTFDEPAKVRLICAMAA